MFWLLHDAVFKLLEHAQKNMQVTLEQQQAFDNIVMARASDDKGILNVVNGVGIIPIVGVLTEKPDFWAWLLDLDNTTYRDIERALAQAEMDPNVKEIVLQVSSPGGNVAGLFETVDLLAASQKPMRTEVHGLMASAAFALGSQGDTIEATHRSAQIGSVGVVVQMWAPDDLVTITNSASPNKRPDVKTEEGKKAIQKELDAIHEMFVDALVSGRGTTAAKVNSDFGRGGMFLANEAEKRGMIDSVRGTVSKSSKLSSSSSQSTALKGGQSNGAKAMTLQELLAQHPALCEQLRKEGHDAGVIAERDRVSAHLAYGAQAGNFDNCIKLIKEGAQLSQSVIAEYNSAIMAKMLQNARQDDDVQTGEGADNAQTTTDNNATAKKDEATTVALAFEKCGLDVNATEVMQ